MTRVHVIVEGQTEEAFVNEVLEPALRASGIIPSACLIGRPGHKGGNVSLERVCGDAAKLLKQDRSAFCTTLIDYYGLGAGFSNRTLPPNSTTDAKAAAVELDLAKAVAVRVPEQYRPDARFIPNVVMHEFEGLLFSDPDALARGLYDEAIAAALRRVRAAFACPEDINDGPETAPSKRIAALHPPYAVQKPLLGALAAIEVGLPAIRAGCPRFAAWLARLERLGAGG